MLVVLKDLVIVDNNDIMILIVIVVDIEGNVIVNIEVIFILLEDVRVNFMLSDGGKVVIDVDGKVKVMLKGIKVGVYIVIVLMVGGKSEQLVVNFIVDIFIVQVNFNVIEDNFIVNNVGMIRLQVIVIDGNGNLLVNEVVIFMLLVDVSVSFIFG